MKIRNKTDYETRPLQTIIRRVAAEELDRELHQRMTVEIIFATRGISRGGYLGFCYRGGWVQLILPKSEARLDVEKIAHVAAHEFAHARGMNHKDMRGNPRYDWVQGIKVTLRRDAQGNKIPTGRTWNDGSPIEDDWEEEHTRQTGWRDIVRERRYCEGIETISRQLPSAAPAPGLDEKLLHAQAKLQEWERKKRRADTGLRSWSRKVKYFQRQVAAKKASEK